MHNLVVLQVQAPSQVALLILSLATRVGSRQQVSFFENRVSNSLDVSNFFWILVNLTASAAKKRSAPNAPAVSGQPQQPIYGTLPHSAGRYQQSYDLSDIYNSGTNISTLPHPPRNSMTQNSNNNNVPPNQPQQQFDNKVYERFEPYMMQASKASHKRSPSSDSITRSINLGEFESKP